MNTAILGISSVIVHGEYDRKPSLEETEKIADFFGETRFEVEVKSPKLSQWVLSIANLVQLAIQK